MIWWTLAFASPLEVHVPDVADDKGTLIVAACRTSSSWLDLDDAPHVQRLPAAPGDHVVRFDVEPGTWAVWVIHDRNDNGELDMRWFPIPGPSEPTGVSNNVRPKLGPPRFRDASLQVPAKGARIEVELQ